MVTISHFGILHNDSLFGVIGPTLITTLAIKPGAERRERETEKLLCTETEGAREGDLRRL